MKINYSWTKNNYEKFLKYLVSISDEKTKVFNERIFATKYEVLGIKVPVLRTLQELQSSDPEAEAYRQIQLPEP